MLCLTIRGAASSGFGRSLRFGASAVEIIQLIAIAINCYQLISIDINWMISMAMPRSSAFHRIQSSLIRVL